MDTEQSRRALDLFESVIDLVADERASFLDEACRDDDDLRAAVESMLRSEPDARGFMDGPLIEVPRRDQAAALIGKEVGGYLIEGVVASGGMGIVYEAVQREPRRTVALKVMRRGIASRSALRRFRDEAQLLASLRHPGIAQVFEAGVHDDGEGGVPFFANGADHHLARKATEVDLEQHLFAWIEGVRGVYAQGVWLFWAVEGLHVKLSRGVMAANFSQGGVRLRERALP